jgi:dihydrofolate reductase
VAYITRINYAYEADAHFPDLDQEPDWSLAEESEEQTYFDLEYVFTRYERKA